MRQFLHSILAGIVIGLAMIMLVSLTAMGDLYRIFGALIFAFALTYIKEQGLLLFTGKAGTDFLKKDLFTTVLGGNLLGTFLIGTCGAMVGKGEVFWELLSPQFKASALEAIIKAILCGALMRIACDSKNSYVTVGCVFAFLVSGLFHSIAMSVSMFASLATEPGSCLKSLFLLITVILGNWIGAMGISKLKSTP